MKYKLRQTLDINNPLYSLLEARGVENPKEYIQASKEDVLDPYLLENMEKGVDLFLKHIDKKSKIFLQVDSDFDGYTSAAMIYNFIKEIDEKIEITYDIHKNKHHGINVEAIPEDIDFIIVPDASSSENEIHKELYERGIETLVLDHHVVEEKEVESPAVIINHQISPNYPNKTLSGGGITFKFCQAVSSKLDNPYLAEYFIDLCATSIVSDMMDLRNKETRYFIKRGLTNIVNPGLIALVEKQSYSLGEKLTPMGIAFYITPLINAIIRVGTEEEKVMLFRSLIEGEKTVPSTKRGEKNKIETIAVQSARNATNCKNRQKRAIDAAMEDLDIKIQKNDLMLNSIIFVPIEEEVIEPALTGLIAMKFCAKYGKPVILARKGEDNVWRGSARGVVSGTGGLKNFFDQSELFEYTAGHQGAHGLGIEDDNIEKLIEYSNEQIEDVDFDELETIVDFKLNAKVPFEHVIEELSLNSDLWGQGIEEPRVLIENLTISSEDLQAMGANKDTSKIFLGSTPALRFKDKDFISQIVKNRYSKINLIGRCNLNFFRGETTPQFIIEDYEIINNLKEF